MVKNIKKQKKRVKLKYRRLIIGLCFILFFGYCVFNILTLPIKNIYIKNNTIFTDQEIIELAGIEDYPSSFKTVCILLEKKLEDNIYIKKANVYKKGMTEIHIDITENRPLFYDQIKNKTILMDMQEVTTFFNVPTLINYVPDTIYNNLIKKISDIDIEILKRISEIQYKPNEVDKNRFLLAMSDGNYVYITLNKFNNINKYIDIIKKFENKKGILYLDAGNSFTIIEK